ncbi:hypothetical protein M427DRAFT_42447 [Gonapodya prolifera JEL478]|uniref:Uncharacterized protein n=1 Tax=Gonapodya prolifera (strain JEL478) TaxID=1344416 RepID=A0A139ANQ5_GONPJ|nr:hypothetical protein M427DRAFT_42447 [Gonapodya prolifera JEL478]|eukprot:KXS18358.1 hypothetical protein M427DRAFT_42447 [Gonapodya prolifera JEL478]
MLNPPMEPWMRWKLSALHADIDRLESSSAFIAALKDNQEALNATARLSGEDQKFWTEHYQEDLALYNAILLFAKKKSASWHHPKYANMTEKQRKLSEKPEIILALASMATFEPSTSLSLASQTVLQVTKLKKDMLLTNTAKAFVKVQWETEELSNSILWGKSKSANSSPSDEDEDKLDKIKALFKCQFTSLASNMSSSQSRTSKNRECHWKQQQARRQ